MRLGMLADTYKPHISGVTNHISLTKEHLEKDGHEVFVFTFGDEDFQDDEPNVIRTPGLPMVDTGFYLGLRYKKEARKLLRTMDVVHVHHPFLSGNLALFHCKPRGIPVAFTNHTRYDLYAQAYFPRIPGVVGNTILEAYLPAFCRSCTMVISPSAGVRKVLQDFGVDVPIEVAPNGVDLTPFRKRVDPIDRARFGFGSEDLVLIYTGRLGPEKNVQVLLRAFNGVSQAYQNVRLLIVGMGPDKEHLEDWVKQIGLDKRVKFTGFIPYQEIPKYLAMADVYTTASFTEVHPLSVIEAMAAGLPVLGVESPGVGDIVENGVTGYLSTNDVATFTALMTRIVLEHDNRKAMGANAKLASEQFAIEHTTKYLAKLYQLLIENSKPAKRNFRVRFNRLLDTWR